jgi:alkanesulfonate monooxygenase SsuD/methylene tetrahydromethanopterin reductase-like flavin-dependent oxidoreductase (luciferase family)
MQFGVQFFPDVRPEERSAEQYFREALDIAEKADRLGFSHIRIVEHYFHYYGGYSPNPIVFLAAAPSAPNARDLSPVRCCRRSTIR